MLQAIREKATGWIAWIVVILISIPFALWGLQEYTGGGGPRVVATVNGTDIALRDLQQGIQRERSRMREMFGDAADRMVDDASLRRRVLDRMVDAEVRGQAASDAGFRVSDTRIAMEINSIDAFRVEGRFDQRSYERALLRAGYTPASFEQQLRADLLTSQFVEATTSSAFTTAAEIAAIAALQGQVRDFEYIVVDAELLAEGFVPDDGAVKQEYESDSNRFMEPEKVKVELVRLSLETLMKGVDVDEVALESLYAEQRSRYVREEQRRARHILLELAEDAGQSKVDEVMAEMRSLRERIVAGESFEELAAAHSADPGSREQGGDLGFFGRGTMVAAFDESVFSLQPGELSEPVRTPFGLHLIRLESVNEGEVKPFSEVRSEVEESYRRQLAEKQIVDQLDLMTSIAFESPSSLDELVRTLGLEVEQSDWFSRQGGQGLFAEKMLRDAAFDPDVLEAGHNSVPVELKGEGYVVLRLIDRKPASKKPLGEVREEIATILIEREGARLAGEEAERLLAAAVAGAKLADLAGQEGGLELKVLSGVTRDAPQGAPAPLLKRVFAMARPDGGSRSLDQVELARGDRAVVELQSVAEGDADDSTAMAEQRAATIGREEFGGLMDGLKSRAKIEIFSRVLNEESL